jgi:hypothetical protein
MINRRRLTLEERMRRIALLIGALALVACTGSSSTPNGPTLRVADVVGQWIKVEKSLPPIDLLLSRDGDLVRARLRLSGSESNGTATVDGSQVTLRFPDRGDIVGKFVSESELELQFDLPPQQQRLQKQPTQ